MVIRFVYLILILNILKIVLACEESITTVSGTYKSVQRAPFCSGELIFQDNFDTFNFDLWEHEQTLSGGGNGEFQWYTNNRSNSFTKEGILHLRPTLTSEIFGEDFLTFGTVNIGGGAPADKCTDPSNWGCSRTGSKDNIINPIRSARVRTVESFNFKYGKVEVKAKVPSGDWLWPAIWMLPKRNAYGTWPASGEIDIMESRGNQGLVVNGVNVGTEQIGATLHYGPFYPYDGYDKAHFVNNTKSGEGFDKDFHTYGVLWTPTQITFFLDDSPIGTVKADEGFYKYGKFPDNVGNPWEFSSKMAPFDQEFFLILNLAVGGVNSYFPDNAESIYKKPWLNNSPHAAKDFWDGWADWLPTWKYSEKDNYDRDFQIDYVRVYAL